MEINVPSFFLITKGVLIIFIKSMIYNDSNIYKPNLYYYHYLFDRFFLIDHFSIFHYFPQFRRYYMGVFYGMNSKFRESRIYLWDIKGDWTDWTKTLQRNMIHRASRQAGRRRFPTDIFLSGWTVRDCKALLYVAGINDVIHAYSRTWRRAG